jgi:hypothetical protein
MRLALNWIQDVEVPEVGTSLTDIYVNNAGAGKMRWVKSTNSVLTTTFF